MTLKERFLKIKAAFDGTPPPVNPPAPAPAPAPPPTTTMKTCKLMDGTEIQISQAGQLPAVGDMVTIAGAPAPAGTYNVDDGSVIVVDATGAITSYTPAAPPATPPAPPANPPAPAAPPAQPVTLSAEQVAAMYAKFMVGSPEERLSGLEVMVKALMESSFGWKIREGQENTAIEVYKETLCPMPSYAMDQMSAVFAKAEKAEEQEKIIARHEETIKGLFELVEKLVELPTDDPKTLTGNKKDRFDRTEKREKKFEAIAAALKEAKKQ